MKRKILITLSLVTASLLFTACGEGSPHTSSPALIEDTPTEVSPMENSLVEENTTTTVPKEEETVIGKEPVKESNNTQSLSHTNPDLVKKEPYYKYAWHINSADSILNDKGYTVHKNADINITEAWKLTMGAGVKVAVIDDGADVTHEDLKSNIYITYNADDESTNVKGTNEEGTHGNSCAGFIVAPVNGKGTVGIAPESKLIAIRQEIEDDAYVVRAFEYAKKQGAKVISCSWGTENVSEVVVAELKSIYDAGITVVFASGNEGTSLDSKGLNDESEVEWVIGVGASTELNDVGSYSNYGKNIDLIAPGGDTQESSGMIGLDDMGEKGSSNGLDLVNENYSFMDGTSFATPVVAGVVALMYAVNPEITPAQVRKILTATATHVGIDSDADYETDGFDKKRAYGKLNAGRAVFEAKKIKSLAI